MTPQSRRRAWRPILVIPVSLALLIAACGGSSPSDEEGTPAEVPTILAEVSKVTRQTISEELAARGAIAALPNGDAKVSSLVPGRVIAVLFAEGDSIREGQVIARLDPGPLEDQRRQAAAAVAQAKAALEAAQANMQRSQMLFEKGVAAAREAEDAKKELAAAQSGLEEATAALDTAKRQVGRAEVRSPISGQVVKRMVSGGEQVDGTAAQPILEIANLDQVELEANVPSGSLSRVRVGQAASVSSDGSPGRTFEGSVVAIAPAVDPGTNAALVRIRIANSDHLLKVGMFAEARVQLSTHAGALVVPPSAVVRGQDGTAAVYVVNGDLAQRTEVKVGLEKPDGDEILSGVEEGQTVLSSSVYGLGDKAKLAHRGSEKSDSEGSKPRK
ncbi:MAG TPA: efflux RND transporter periplasmic adaptor subunit [Candidatus Polarisedimenticolia bacterium]|nr:efflux RND transporter periplasmic adaptor subunit [Candidatus Polarisedimenticolia bacterium]